MSDTYFGTYKGIVVDNDDPDRSYRVVCNIPQVLGDAVSAWCEPMQPTLYTPRIGDIVWVQFVDGDPNQPLYQSRFVVTRETMEPGTMTITGADIPDFSLIARKFKTASHSVYEGDSSPVTLYTDTPTTGSIAWDAFTIEYLGVDYSIAAGNTTDTYVWWLYNGGAGGPLSTDTVFPSSLTADDLVLFLNKNGVPVNVQMASTVDGSLIVPESILTQSLAAGAVTTDKLDANALSAGFALFGTIDVGPSGQPPNITIDGNNGITVDDTNGQAQMHVPSDGSAISVTAEIDALSLNVRDDLAISGTGEIYGAVSLNGGTVAPKHLPSLSTTWKSQTFFNNQPFDAGVYFSGLRNDPANSAQLVTIYSDPTIPNPQTQFWYMNKSDGSFVARVPSVVAIGTWENDFSSIGGLAYIANPGGTGVPSFYVMGQDYTRGQDIYVYQINASTLAKISEVRWGDSNWFHGLQPRLFSDGTNVGVTWVANSTQALTLRWLNPTTLATIGSDVHLIDNVGIGYNVGAATFDSSFGSNRLYVYVRGHNYLVIAFDPSSSYAIASGNFIPAGDYIGMVYDTVAGQTVAIDRQGNYWKHGTSLTTTTSTAKITWYDADATGGTHETTPGSAVSYTIPARAYVSVSCPAPPDALNLDITNHDRANQVRFYWGAGSSPGTGAWSLATFTADPWGGILDGLNDPSLTTGQTPPTTNSFPTTSSTPGNIMSGNTRLDGTPKVYIDGAGKGNLDGLVPPGSIMMWGGANAPTGWYLCRGTTENQSTDPDLYAAIGTAYGTGDGTSGSFSLPDLRARFPIGQWPQDSTTTIANLGAYETSGAGGGAPPGVSSTTVSRLQHRHTHTIVQANTFVRTGSSSGDTGSPTDEQGVGGTGADLAYHGFMVVNFIIKR